MALSQRNFEDCAAELASLFEAQRRESVCDWVEANVELPTGAITGRIQLDRTPYWREPLERWGDKRTRNIVVVSSTQSAKTTFLICGMLYKIAKDPEDAMWIFGNTDQARDFNKERFMAFAQMCRPVYELIPKTTGGVIDKNRWGFLNQHYRTMVVNFVGAGSRTNLSSRPRGLIVMDETDKYYDELSYDAGTIQLAEERMKSFPFPLVVKASSPSEPHRMIWAEYLKTHQGKYMVPCPRCGGYIFLKFRVDSEVHGECGLRWYHDHVSEAMTDGEWDYRKVRANAFYKCQLCGGMIHDFERYDMLNAGRWEPQNPRAPDGSYGYHVNSLYSILGPETSFGSIAVKFLQSKGSRSELKNFVTGWLAEPWEESMAYNPKKVTFEVVEDSEVKFEGTTPLMAIDYQMTGFWVLVRRFAPVSDSKPYGESWLVYADFVQTQEEISHLMTEYGVAPENAVMDMAKNPNQAGRIILGLGIRGMWGSVTKQFWHRQPDGTRVSRLYSPVQFRDPMLGTAWENRTFERVRYVYFSKDGALDLVSALRYAEPPIWHASSNVNPVYARHINAYQKRYVKNRRTGRLEWLWVNAHHDDHLADCENMVTVLALMRGLAVPPPSVVELPPQ